ncbi:MAG TPA: chromate transporter [Burkholderiales bacterium]|nr:chromate transporter [Burkholderiales bacterium]
MSAGLLYLLLLKATLTSFSGLSSMPIVRDELVMQYGVLTDSQLNAAVALARAAPGPFGGYVISVGYFVGGVAGGIAGWLALITPALLAIPLVHYVARSTAHPRARSLVNAVIVASAALILAATVPIAMQALGGAALIVIAAGSAVVLAVTGVDTVWVIAASGVAGLLAASLGAPL